MNGNIYIAAMEGTTAIIEDGDAYKLLAENEIDGRIMASPIAIDGDLILRSDTALYRIQGP